MRFDDDSRRIGPSGEGGHTVPLPADVLDRLLTDTLDEVQAARVRRLLTERPVRRRLLDDLRVWVRRDEAGRALFDHAAAWASIRTAIDARMDDVSHTSMVSSRPSDGARPSGWPRHRFATREDGLTRRRWSSMAPLWAGVAVLAIGIAAAGWLRRTSESGAAGPMVTYTTTNGERANITLPDGSVASLDVASRLEVPANYQSGNRTVRLTGEALFTITHHGNRPFTVIAGSEAARVLGTSFIVRHYPTDTSTLVAVRDGRVAVHATVLAAAQEMDAGPSGTSAVRPLRRGRFSFVTGTLSLESVPAKEAIAELDRWYDADIRLGDPSLAGTHVTGECAAGSLADLTEILEWTFNARVVRNGRVLTILPRER